MSSARHTVYLVHSASPPERHLNRLRALAAHGELPLPWLFLDEDIRTAFAWERALGDPFRRISTGPMLNAIADELRLPFAAWMDDLGARYGSDPHWWFSDFSERNTLVSPLFLLVCYLAVAKRCLSSESLPRLVIAQSWGLIDALQRLSKSLGLELQVISPGGRYVHRVRQFEGMIRTWASFLRQSVRNHRVARRTRPGRTPAGFSRGPDRVLIDTFFDEKVLSSDGVFHDRFFPFLHEWLDSKGQEVWVLPTVLTGQSSIADKYRWMRESSARFLIPEDWLRPSDYLNALFCGLKARLRPGSVARLNELNIRSLVCEERRRQGVSIRILSACLLSRLPGRLRAAGFVPDRIIEWSENQIQDKALVVGCRRAFPNATYTAVQNTPLPPNLVNLFPTAVECDSGVTADRVVCSGPLPAQILTRMSGGKLKTVVGCGLRYAYLWDAASRRGKPVNPGSPLTVLIALPIAMSLAVDLMDLMTPIYEDRASTVWHIKPHPANDVEALRRTIPPTVSRRVTFVGGRLSDWLNRTDVVVTTTSGVALEAVALGLPVIQVGSRTALNYDPLVWFKDVDSVTCCSREEIRRELDRIASFTDADYAAIRERGRAVLEGWFAPVTEEALQAFLAR